jgi:hypothetical protein
MGGWIDPVRCRGLDTAVSHRTSSMIKQVKRFANPFPHPNSRTVEPAG